MKRGIFITIEGIEGAGKSTAIQFIQDYLTANQCDVLLTREPGGTPLAEEIRKVLLFPQSQESMLPETELLLGQWVISDRFLDASYAYQVGGRQIAAAQIDLLAHHFVGDLKPQLTFLLDIPPELGLKRAKNRGLEKDRIESEKIDFFKRVRNVYLERATLEPDRIRVVDASQSLDQVKAAIYKILKNQFPRHPGI
jgi:dTMP kinase